MIKIFKMYSINQHWDKLKVCAVGSVYSSEVYSFIQNTNVRSIMEKISIETDEDYQSLISILKKFNVEIIRTNAEYNSLLGNKLLPPPLSPRDHLAMIGNKFYAPDPSRYRKWNTIKSDRYPKLPPESVEEFENLPNDLLKELNELHNIKNLFDCYTYDYSSLLPIVNLVQKQGNEIIYNKNIDSAMTCRIGKDLYFGTWPGQDGDQLKKIVQKEFPEYRCHIIKSDGHLDGVLTPVAEGLILCRRDCLTEINFKELFPGWEIVPIGRQATKRDYLFHELKSKNAGRWWVPGEEYNDDFTEFVNSYMDFCVGNIEETTIGVNVLMVNKNNLICSEEDLKVFKILEKYGITPHVTPIRHHYFWDNGIHCQTTDLDREGELVDYFPQRKWY